MPNSISPNLSGIITPLEQMSATPEMTTSRPTKGSVMSKGYVNAPKTLLIVSGEITTRIRLRPRILRDVSVTDTQSTILGTEISFPVGIAPTAFHCLAWPEGELATAKGKYENTDILG